jgi:hypothetical protein
VLLLIMLLSPALAAQAKTAPQPPCGAAPYPAWPDTPGHLAVMLWDEQQLPAWQPPACTGWQAARFSMLLAASGRLDGPDSNTTFLERLGRVSALAGLRYWSVSRDRWTTLIEQAHALTGPDRDARRPDFTPDELQTGRDYLYWQHEPTTSGSAIYALRLLERSPQRLVISVRNVGPARRLGITLLAAGRAESLYVIERLDDNQWGYYQLTRLGHGRHDWLPVTRASYANRAIALFSHFAGLPQGAVPVWKDAP